ncbi:pentatricopeptide repeat-containing protein At3g09040, mitochondrial-like [Momordica charantia]|uniref:Pentatricopeptide repeat-containing protein At3g09040, mitochondrial-like n=1 Tax=Momordica charantia TaxID=3673 RepID=A0A6J1CEF5_MOMCH|nr:pentatricopeptide repeat-containing protein At3g09040, mitochondrial-like [Momordica charantia]XP_022138913.1 pentatricopeptide repeat-containing protein At3g09040, mitochondrial-like [Momordica charantia]
MKTSALGSGFVLLANRAARNFHLLFERFLSYNISVGTDSSTIATALSLSENARSSILGAQVHGHICKLGFTCDTFSMNNLIKMYAKCGFMCEAFKVFDQMPLRNVVSWSLIISGAAEDGGFEFCLGTFLDMMRGGLMPNEFTLGSVMKACADVGAYGFGLSVHCLCWKLGIEQNVFVGGSTLSMYARFGDIASAELVFESMERVDVGFWNAMIGGYTNCGFGLEALRVVSLMNSKSMKMDKFTIVSALKACSIIRDLDSGRELQGFMLRRGLISTVAMNALLDMYLTNGRMNSALKTFNSMQSRDIISWNTVFGGFRDENNMKEIVNLFSEFMLEGMKPNHITFSALFRQCGTLLDYKLGFQFCSLVVHLGFLDEPSVLSSIISMFSQCGLMEMVLSVFDSVVFKPISVWNQLLLAYSLNSSYTEAFRTFSSLWRFGVEANEYTYSIIVEITSKSEIPWMCRQLHCAAFRVGFGSHKYISCSLIKCYIKIGLLESSFEIFNQLESVDIATWGVMISALVHQNHTYEAIMFLNILMESGEKPDDFIFGSILNGCSSSAAYHQTKAIHSLVEKMGFGIHVHVASAVIDAYAKCGDIGSAQRAFEQSCRSNDVILYNSMIMAYAHHGLAWQAIQIFEKMRMSNLQPNQATFVSVISACGHIGLIKQGHSLFQTMKSDYNIIPSRDNFGCLVDMLSRNGFLHDARYIIESMPFPPWPAILRSLLSGCRIYGNRELGQWAAEKLLSLAPQNDAAYVLLSKVYSEGNSWEDAATIRNGMTDRGVLKDPGCSRIEI